MDLTPTQILIVYCLLILLASLAGGWIPMLIRLTHKRMELAASFVAGFMLGVGLIHLLPHAWETAGSPQRTVMWFLAGFLAVFFIERVFASHQHEIPSGSDHDSPPQTDHGHDHGRTLTWGGAAVGLTMHSLINGVALASSIQVDSQIESHS